MEEIYIKRAENEIVAAEKLKEMSEDSKTREFMQVPDDMTFYSAAISHSYYSIFYAAKALLLTKGIKTSSPDVHKRTLDAFKEHFVDTGVLDVKLLEIYRKLVIRADELLDIFRGEKQKRGDFTYKTIPQANKEPADDSVKNAKIFVSNIRKVIGR
jgi:uncharacterized protein (UPF0332 family)